MGSISKEYHWIKIADNFNEIFFGENKIASVEVNGKTICIAQTPNGLKSCTSQCPHAGSDLSQSSLDIKGNIICPVHGYRFSLYTGRDSNDEGYFLKLYPVKENEEGIFIGFE